MFLTMVRTSTERCEQCDSTEHVLQLVSSANDEDTVRLTACVVCVVVALDNALGWKMSRSFAVNLAAASVGEQLQEEIRKTRERFKERVTVASERARAHTDGPPAQRQGDNRVRHSGTDAGTSRRTGDRPTGRVKEGASRSASRRT